MAIYLAFLVGAFCGGGLRFAIGQALAGYRVGGYLVPGTLVCNALGTALLAWLFTGPVPVVLADGGGILAGWTPWSAWALGVTGGLSTLSTVAAECIQGTRQWRERFGILATHTAICVGLAAGVVALRGGFG